MAHRNSIDDKDIEKLLELAEKPKEKKPKKEVKRKHNDAEKFIKKFKIAEGDVFIPTEIVYYTYWKSKDRDRLNNRSFMRYFNAYFDKTVSCGYYGYYLDKTPFTLTQEEFFKARAVLRRKRNAKKDIEEEE